jgi:hypothetical protein
MFVLHATTPDDGTISVLGNQANRTNFMYLSTFTRASGLLLGAGAAFVWRPWRSTRKMLKFGTRLDPFGAVTLTLLVCIMSVAELTAGYVYQWLLALVSVLSILTIMVVVHPAALGFRALLSWRPLVEIGRRSYGLYLWHWPIFVFSHTYHSGSYTRVVVATLITVAVSEVSYRFIETPIRNDFVHQWFRDQRAAMGSDRVRRIRRTTTVLGVVGAIAVGMVGFYASVAHFDPAVGGTEVFFSVPTIPLPTTVPFDPAVTTTAPVAPVVSVAPSLPRRVTIVGDSQAHALAINLPTGIESTFTINDGSIDGCGVYDSGRVVSTRTSFRRSFADCSGWAEKWGRSASSAKAEVALVVLGAWDVFDLQLADRTLVFGTPEADGFYLAQLQQGIDSLKATGAHVALLEVACMRPKDVKGAGVPALPERGDDTRTGHVNDLLKQAVAKDPTHVSFVAGPQAWCSDQAISVDLAYRWDGVHVYKAGANLIFLIITPALLKLPVQ